MSAGVPRAVAAASGSTTTSQVELFFAAARLPNMDTFSKSDPFLAVYLRTPTGGWAQIDTTEVIFDNNNPSWAKQVLMEWAFETVQHVRFELWDYDGKGSKSHDYLGEATATLGSILGARAHTITLPLSRDPAKGRPILFTASTQPTLTIRAAEVKGSGSDLLRLQARCCGLDKKDFFGSSDPYITILRLQGDGSRMKVWQSTTIMNDLNPVWEPVDIPVQRICNGDATLPLVVQVWDYDKRSADDLIGEFPCCLNDLLAAGRSGHAFALINPKKQAKKGAKYSNSGTMLLPQARIVRIPSFLEYLSGGCAINLMVAIDLTGSNGHPMDAGSLHYYGGGSTQPNEYLQAITSCGGILLDYDYDGRPAAFGFGASINSAPVSHCFALNFNERDPEVPGLDGLIGAYKNCFNYCALSGPTYFAPLIRRAAEAASAGISAASQKYTVLLLLTDGQCCDIDETTRAIVEASVLPLSIVIVGVGGADFSAMDFLDADGQALKWGGKVAARDIVQFVPFRKYAAYGAGAGSMLAKEVLKEIPGQLVAAFTARSIMPNPPVVAAAPMPPPMMAGPGSGGAGGGLRLPTMMPGGFSGAGAGSVGGAHYAPAAASGLAPAGAPATTVCLSPAAEDPAPPVAGSGAYSYPPPTSPGSVAASGPGAGSAAGFGKLPITFASAPPSMGAAGFHAAAAAAPSGYFAAAPGPQYPAAGVPGTGAAGSGASAYPALPGAGALPPGFVAPGPPPLYAAAAGAAGSGPSAGTGSVGYGLPLGHHPVKSV